MPDPEIIYRSKFGPIKEDYYFLEEQTQDNDLDDDMIIDSIEF